MLYRNFFYVSCNLSVQDPDIATSLPVIDLVDAIKPGAIKYDLVNTGSTLSEEVCCVSGVQIDRPSYFKQLK